ncbi:hypothetical protein [Micromonospora sp. NPDC048169]|uniref:hypothetical protein n=1 Tax=Micromonospora sp. NPDC048169 TaxID=3154711 RepID=UPI0033D21C6D
MTRLHLSRPHIAEAFAAACLDGWCARLTTDDLTTPAAQESWAQWDPDRWMAEHGRKEETR